MFECLIILSIMLISIIFMSLVWGIYEEIEKYQRIKKLEDKKLKDKKN